MFSSRVLILLVLFGAVAIIASSPAEESSDEEELDLSERGLINRFCEKRLHRHHKRGLQEDEPSDEDIDEMVARVAKLNPGSRSWGSFFGNHAAPLAAAALHAAGK
ncbi:hypothetical protein HOLleu_11135 [Holothuria leucospilota]|uniref:Uncharacterized protein n=1 Tax=Holothuria leucospilota TaxID=206669 RepID=A0A9Q1CFP3_HOLLE|nr:hypothetical protein HOLleu_11135 [Holothuria leucospilota]